MVRRAGKSDSTQALVALSALCQAYWFPLYAFVRHRGYSPHDAEDITQGFFEKLIRIRPLGELSPTKGKFRAFLLAALKNFMTDEWKRATAQKRGGNSTLSLDAMAAEDRYSMEPQDDLTPERVFERQWALTLLESVVANLARKYEADGRKELFETLRFSIIGEKSVDPYSQLAIRLGMSEEAIRVAVFRLRKEYRQGLLKEISHTVDEPEMVREELQALRRILAET